MNATITSLVGFISERWLYTVYLRGQQSRSQFAFSLDADVSLLALASLGHMRQPCSLDYSEPIDKGVAIIRQQYKLLFICHLLSFSGPHRSAALLKLTRKKVKRILQYAVKWRRQQGKVPLDLSLFIGPFPLSSLYTICTVPRYLSAASWIVQEQQAKNQSKDRSPNSAIPFHPPSPSFPLSHESINQQLHWLF